MTVERKQQRFYGPWIAMGSFLLIFSSQVYAYSISVFFHTFINDMGWSRGNTAMGVTLNFLVTAALAPFVGRLLHILGPKRMIVYGCLITAVSSILLSTLTQLWQFYLYYALILGCGVSAMGTIPSNTIINNWYVRRRGIALGVAMSGLGAGGSILVPLAQAIISDYGWRVAFLCLAGFPLIIGIPMASLVMKVKPEDIGQLPDGETPHQSNPAELSGFTFRQALRTRALWLIGIGTFLFFFVHQMSVTHSVAHAVDVGIPGATAAAAIGILALISIPARLGFGWLGDMIEKRYVLTIVATCSLSALIALTLLNSVSLLYFFAVFQGIAVGGFAPTVPAILADYFGIREYGTIYGFTGSTLLMLGAATGPIIAGYIFDYTRSYFIAFIIGIMAVTVAIIAYYLARRPKGLD